MTATAPAQSGLRRPVSISLPRRRGPAVVRTATERLWILVGAVAAGFVLLVGYLMFIAPQRSSTDAVRAQTSAQLTRVAALQAHIASLRAQYKNLATYRAEYTAAQAALPTADDVPTLLRTLQSLGAATSTTISSVTIGPPAPVAPATTTAGTAPAGTAPAATAKAATVPVAAAYSMTLTLQVGGTPGALNNFLSQLQKVQPRAVLITQLGESNGASGSGGSTTALTLSLLAFMSAG